MYKWVKLKAPNLFGQRCDKMQTRYDYLASMILKNVDISNGTPNIAALANAQGIEVLTRNSYTWLNRPTFSFYGPATISFILPNEQKFLNPRMAYHLFLSTPSPAECREWIAYCTVIAFLCNNNLISPYFLTQTTTGDDSFRNDTFHRIAVSVLIPEDGLRQWRGKHPNLPSPHKKWPDLALQEAAAYFGVSREVVDERLQLFNYNGGILSPHLMDNVAMSINKEEGVNNGPSK